MNKNIKNNIKNNSYNDIFGIDKSIPELKRSDFIYKNKKLYIKNKYFKEHKGFILFYAPWCIHCKNFSDLFIELAISNVHLFPFGAVNSENINDNNDKLCNFAKIIKYPTLKYIYKDGSLKDYPFEYNIDNLIYYINSNI